MRQAATQQHDFGCGAACVAFAANIPYQKVVSKLGKEKAGSSGFLCKDLVVGLKELGLAYQYRYIKPRIRKRIYQESTIVFIKRSTQYPAGHYLIRHCGQWMDPWINLPANKDIRRAKSGYRKRLPGRPIYAILPFQYSTSALN